jgi:hypothetical protein
LAPTEKHINYYGVPESITFSGSPFYSFSHQFQKTPGRLSSFLLLDSLIVPNSGHPRFSTLLMCPETAPNALSGNAANLGLISGISGGVAVLLVAVIICGLLIMNHRRRSGTPSEQVELPVIVRESVDDTEGLVTQYQEDELWGGSDSLDDPNSIFTEDFQESGNNAR